jgi:hypothetical protein
MGQNPDLRRSEPYGVAAHLDGTLRRETRVAVRAR